MAKLTRINHQISVPRVLLVMPDGQMRGEVSIAEARSMADQMSLDLVEVSPGNRSQGTCPVCKIMDYGKLKYSQSKKKRSSHSPAQTMKEIKTSVNISDHDLGIKHNKIKSFLEKKHKVKYTLELRGRQRSQFDLAHERFEKHLEDFKDVATWDKPSISGKGMSVMLMPV